jgi:dipeptidyl aminopeptidase/acylaminoacyl peptidase
MSRAPLHLLSVVAYALLAAFSQIGVAVRAADAQQAYSIADVLSPAFPYELVSARSADRIAWLEYERGVRNVWVASAPRLEPRRLTPFTDDDGVDLTGLQISEDGSVVTFIRGHTPNSSGWVANPASDPAGGERVVWAMRTSGGRPWRVVEAASYRLSPDGRWVLFVRDGQIHRAPVDPRAREIDAESSRPFFTVYGQNSAPVWSPDGARVAFVSARGDHSYVGVYDVRSPKVTYLAPGVDRDASPTWSPDGTRVAFLRRPGLPFGAAAGRAGGAGGGRAAPEGGGRGVAQPAQGRQGTEPPPGLMESAFAGGHDLEIWVADAATGAGRRVWRNVGGEQEGRPEPSAIEWVADRLVFEAEPGNWERWYSLAVDGTPTAEPVELTPGEGAVEATAFSADGRWLYYASNAGDIDRRDLWRVPVAGGSAEQLTRGDGIEHYPAVFASGDQVAILYADAKRPLSVGVVPAAGGAARTITGLPSAYPLEELVVPQAVTLTAEDGFEFYNQLWLPPDLRPGERRPALVFIHGGSRRQMLLGYHYMHFYHMAYAMNQYFAAQGYVVLSVNYRSGIGYGREFRTAENVGRNGNAEYKDVLAAGKYLQSRPDVDPEKVGVWGLSYGGILTAQALSRNSDIFKAGVDMAGVHLWGSSLDPESVSYQASAISQIAGWRSPVLLIHGDDDRNVAFSQTVGLVQLLRAHGVPHELIVFPDDVHDSLLFHRWLQAFGATDDFFRRALVRGEKIAVAGGDG